jgi:hypothetical protein
MTETERIVDQLRRIHDGDAWYGPAMADALRGVTAAQAAHRPIPQAHTIWEIVLHATGWNREVLRRLRTGVCQEPEDGDWPAPPADATEGAWRAAVEALHASFRELIEEAERFPAERLDEIVGDARERPLGSGVSFYVLLHGIVQHNAAHAAQISLLRRASA